MSWTFGSVIIFPQDIPEEYDQSIARLSPLEGGTVFHVFGYDDGIMSVNAFIVGSGDKNILKGYNRDGVTHELLFNSASWGNFYLKKFKPKLEPVIYQTIRSDLPCETSVYSVDMELYQEE